MAINTKGAFNAKGLSQSGELGCVLEQLRIMTKPKGSEVIVVANGFYLEPEVLVLRDSEMFAYTAPEFEHPDMRDARVLRDSLIEDGTLVHHRVVYVFQRDYVFRSSSLAASVILGQPASGPDMWRDIWGTKLADLLAEPAPA